MTRAFYNEHDPFAAAWLRELIAAGHIAPGVVDERDIRDITEGDLEPFTQVHMFAGIGGWSLALRLAGIPDDFPAWTGSCPCQSFSCAGKGEGKEDPRHLWPEMYRLVRQRRPAIVLGEQVEDAIGHEWLDGVFVDLEREDYACGAAVLPAACVGAPHRRHRIYWVADAGGTERGRGSQSGGEHGRALHTSDRSGVDDLAHAEHPESRSRGQIGQRRTRRGRDRSSINGEARHGMDIANGAGSFSGKQTAPPPRHGNTHIATGGNDGGLGNSANGGLAIRGGSPGRPGHSDESGEASDAVALGDGISTGLERHAGNGDHRHEPGRFDPLAAGPTPAAGNFGFWSAFHLLFCRDDKYRRSGIEPGAFPLAYGLPRSVGPLLAEQLGMGGVAIRSVRASLKAAKSNRVIRLKGYGNAIVPQVAAAFIKASLATREGVA